MRLFEYIGGDKHGEWNQSVITDDGRYIALYASGVNGCDTNERLQKYIVSKTDRIYEFNLDNSDDAQSMIEGANATRMIRIGKQLKELGVELRTNCELCRKPQKLDEMEPAGEILSSSGTRYCLVRVCKECANEINAERLNQSKDREN